MSGAPDLPAAGTLPPVSEGGKGRRQRRRAVYRWGVVLLMLVAAFTFAMIAPPGNWTKAVTALLQSVAVLAALSRAGVGRGLFVAALAAIALALGSGVAAIFGGRDASGIASLAGALLLVLVPVSVAIEFRRDMTVTAQSVVAALCVYVVFGMFFATLASAVSDISGSPYFAGKSSANSSDYVYFSFITLATVGYGDFTPALRLGRALAVLEGLMGQLYLVTVVALVVSNLAGRRLGGGRGQGG
jgi:ion channel